jgi:hypothetical protein
MKIFDLIALRLTAVLLSCYGISQQDGSIGAEIVCLNHFVHSQNDIKVTGISRLVNFTTSLFIIQRCVSDSILHTADIEAEWHPSTPCRKDLSKELVDDIINHSRLKSDTVMAVNLSVGCAVEVKGRKFVQIHVAREDSLLGFDVVYELNSRGEPKQVGSIGWIR